MSKTKRDRQREQTYQKIIETAEILFAEHGIGAVSLRQIGIEAGSLNTNAVGYYVGTKEDLIDAIFNYRLPHLEKRRAEYLADLDKRELGMDFRELLVATWGPLYDLKDRNGRHSYARFLLNVDRAGLGEKRVALDALYPTAYEIFRRLNLTLAGRNIKYAGFLLRLQLILVAGALDFIDENQLCAAEADTLFKDTLEMLHAAMLTRAPEPGDAPAA
jgi:AcrR family transcriptional regulator